MERARRAALLVLGAALLSGCAGPTLKRRTVQRPIPPLAKAIIRTAKTFLPEEEQNRKSPKDCSDFVSTVFAENGIKLPRTSPEMSRLGSAIASSKDIQMGDLLFFSGEVISHTVGHVAIYVNNGIFIHFSKPEVGVRMESLYSDYYRKRYLKAKRVIP
ncbi:MAG: C40 family peptidase [Elusimicrobia bacterium]|nr:C40 family peptidase [Elusimicrobiota bacterium]